MKTRVLAGILALGLAGAAQAQQTQTMPAEKPGKDALMQIDEFIANAGIDKSDPEWRTNLPKPEMATFEPGKKYFAVMETNKGTMKIELLPETAPMHVTAFIYLTRLGYYDGLTFHRVITDFMAQGGCPNGDGRGGPGFRMNGEYDPSVRHTERGMMSAANAGPGTDGSQFFLTFKATPWLDGKHTIYGKIVDFGEPDTLAALEAAGSKQGAPTESLKIKKVTIVEG